MTVSAASQGDRRLKSDDPLHMGDARWAETRSREAIDLITSARQEKWDLVAEIIEAESHSPLDEDTAEMYREEFRNVMATIDKTERRHCHHVPEPVWIEMGRREQEQLERFHTTLPATLEDMKTSRDQAAKETQRAAREKYREELHAMFAESDPDYDRTPEEIELAHQAETEKEQPMTEQRELTKG